MKANTLIERAQQAITFTLNYVDEKLFIECIHVLCCYTLSHWRIQDLLKGDSKGQGCGAEAFRFWSKTILNFSSYT